METPDKKIKFEKVADFFDSTKNLWGILLAIVSIVISIIALIKNPNNISIAVSIVTCQIIVLIMYSVFIGSINKFKKELNKEKEKAQNEIESYKKENNTLKDDLDKTMLFINDYLVFNKCIDKRTNNFLTLIPDEGDTFFSVLYLLYPDYIDTDFDKIMNDDYNNDTKNKINYGINNSREKLFDLYKRYVIYVIEETKKTIEKYLQLNNHNESIAITLKLFNETLSNDSDKNKIFAYNAFRDKNTYDEAKREIGIKKFIIDNNDALRMCINKEGYIRNDIRENANDYQNENYPQSLMYFDSTAVVPVVSDYKKDKNYFGYLCCDTLTENGDKEIFNKSVTDILYSAALSIGMVLDALNITWLNISEEKEDFISIIFSKTYKGKTT